MPVLLYHRLVQTTNGSGVAPADFAAEMQRLHDLGFQAISLDQYVRFIRGEPVDLPPRPILITFDDGFLSSFEVADPILARYGWNATIFAITGMVGTPGKLTWAQLRQMQATGRWQIDEHAGYGHVNVTVDAAGDQGPFYANEKSGERGAGELPPLQAARSHGHRARPEDARAATFPGWKSHGTFAVPFNNYGQHGSNDPRIEPWLSRFLKAHFAAIFLQDGDVFSTPGPGFQNRIDVPGGWDPSSLEAHLLAGRANLSGG